MDLLTAIKATYEVIGQNISDLAIQTIALELKTYDPQQVALALTRCRKELRKITLADILERLPGGHLGVEEAWAMVARVLNREGLSIVWTDEMAQAFGPALALKDDPVAARMAFKEAYTRLVQDANAVNSTPVWKVSLGYEKSGRELALQDAVAKGRITQEYACKFLPPPEINAETLTQLSSVRVMP